MTSSRDPIFLERRAYRRRRLSDAASLLPLAGFLALVLPVVWAGTPAPTDDGAEPPVATASVERAPARSGASTAFGGIYLFAVWALLIAASVAVSGRLAATSPPAGPGGGDEG